MIITRDKNIDRTGKQDVTNELQEIINSAKGEEIYISEGTYLVSALFIHSNTHIILDNEAVILGTTDESKYSLIDTRVAGIEMKWYPAIINIIGSTHVSISGGGTICGSGQYFYNKYWGNDRLGGMRSEYDKKGLRWACDYDCMRVRNVLVSNSSDVKLMDFSSEDSGFWNIHILYSNNVYVSNIEIISDAPNAPSTDGIDIDSSYNCIIENITASVNDDSIAIKSGRDSDGLRVNIPSHDIKISNCNILKGYGITIGSEVSGGIYNIDINNIKYNGTDCAFRIKSSYPRKGYIKNINVNGLDCKNVKYLFHWHLNWNPNYNVTTIPSDIKDKKPYWDILAKMPSDDISPTIVENINISNVKSYYTDDYNGVSRIFTLIGYDNCPIKNIIFNNVDAKMKEYGIISNVLKITYENCNLLYNTKYDKSNDDFDNR